MLGSPEGHFSNTAHFLETSGAFQGCIRNLEINNKLYNFALQNNGGDAIEGVDIGKLNLQDLNVKKLGVEINRVTHPFPGVGIHRVPLPSPGVSNT